MSRPTTPEAPEERESYIFISKIPCLVSNSLNGQETLKTPSPGTESLANSDTSRSETLANLDSSPNPSHQEDGTVGEGNDPWAIANENNRNNRALYQLPDELVLKIMGHLSPVDFYTLRQSCRLFNKLFQGPEYDDLRKYTYFDDPTLYTWLYPKYEQYGVCTSNLGLMEQLDLKAILQRDSLCQPCLYMLQERRQFDSEMSEAMYCSGCKQLHPKLLFSIRQRQVCIGREGYIRLCEHKTISWSDIEQMKAQEQKAGEFSIRTIVCQHRSHKPSREHPMEMARHFITTSPSVDLSRHWRSKRVCVGLSWLIDLSDVKQSTTKTTLYDVQRKMRLGQVSTGLKLCPHEALSDARFQRTISQSQHASIVETLPGPHTTSQCPYAEWRPTFCECGVRAREASSDAALSRPQPVTHCSKCVICQTRYIWEQLEGVLTLGRKSTELVGSPCDFSWIRLLDLVSYQLEEPANRHLFWCSDSSCATSVRWRKMAAVEKATKQCMWIAETTSQADAGMLGVALQ